MSHIIETAFQCHVADWHIRVRLKQVSCPAHSYVGNVGGRIHSGNAVDFSAKLRTCHCHLRGQVVDVQVAGFDVGVNQTHKFVEQLLIRACLRCVGMRS